MSDALQVKGTTNVSWNDVAVDGAVGQSVQYGRDESGVSEVQVAVATIIGKPTKALMNELWEIRGVKSAMPEVAAAVAPEGVYILSGGSDALPLGPMPLMQAALRLQAGLGEFGIQPAEKVVPLTPIDLDDVRLVEWMAVQGSTPPTTKAVGS